MGEVYRARDAKLGRDVALKILPPAFTADAERVKRFEREARLLASLNHPHIGAIYGFEEAPPPGPGQASVPALVLELVDGETLDERVRRGPLPVAEALTIAQQIADALDAAHGAGIVHRDLKPANIKITPQGVVKVLDFGLAKAADADSASPEFADAATVTSDGTDAGVILGTAGYMSPEQARGKPVDKRTDIWAFGCVLYRMLSGRPAFGGETLSATIVTILERDPDWTAVPATTPPALRRLLQRCLEKDPRRRVRDMGDVRHAIEDVGAGDVAVASAESPSPRRGLAWLLGALAIASTSVAGWLLWAPSTEAPAREPQVQRLTDFVGMEDAPAISPDGKAVAFVARAGGKRQIWIRLLAGGPPRQVTADDVEHEQPRWTPDSSALIYFVPSTIPGEHGTIWKIPMLGGEPRRVAAAVTGGDISHDGRQLALFRFEDTQIVLALVPHEGAGAEEVRPLPPDSLYDYPRWSPDDRWVAFQQDSGNFDERVLVASALRGDEPRVIAQSTNLGGLAWLPDGSCVVYSSSAGSTVLYPPVFNLRMVGRDGTNDRRLTFGDVSYVELDVHSSGTITASRIRMQSDLWKFPVAGSATDNTAKRTQITRQTGQVQTPSVSPDGSEVVYLSDAGGHGNLWIARTDASRVRQLTHETDPMVSAGVPVWSPVGPEIVYFVRRPEGIGLRLIHRDGSGSRQFVEPGGGAAWSADGRWVYYARLKDGVGCIEKAAVGGGGPIPVRCDNASGPAPTPDGSGSYFVRRPTQTSGQMDFEILAARPESGPSQVLARVAGSRIPVNRRLNGLVLSPDGQWLTIPLSDGATSNIWVLPTRGGQMRPLTDFGDRAVVIGRRVSWSSDSKHVYAAVAETDADIVLIVGLPITSG